MPRVRTRWQPYLIAVNSRKGVSAQPARCCCHGHALKIYISCATDQIICLIPLVLPGYVLGMKLLPAGVTSMQPCGMWHVASVIENKKKCCQLEDALYAPWGVLSAPDDTAPRIKLGKSNVLFFFFSSSLVFVFYFAMAQLLSLSHSLSFWPRSHERTFIYMYIIYICIYLMNF